MHRRAPTRRNRAVRAAALLAAALLAPAFAAPALAAGASAAIPEAPAAAAADPGGWTGTWSVSPQSGGPSYGGQTLRQVVHTSISGTSARIHLSNTFGTAPLTVADVHVARRTSGASVDTGTDRAVTFGGQSSVTIPAGQSAVSDAIAFSVPALADVSVSFYLPQSTGSATYHQQGTQTNYVAGGDVSAAASLTNPSTTGSYAFLTNLDVQNSAAQGAVVTLGASITDGVASAQDDNRRWPNDLAQRLSSAGLTVGVLNQGISGNKLLTDGAGQSALNRFDRDVLQQPGVRWVVFSDDPINDVGVSNPPSGAQLISALQQLISRAHAAGISFLCSTLTPFQGSSGWSQAGETAREQVNSFVRGAGSGCDGVVDQDTATHDPSQPTRYLPAYDAGDHLHPNEAGLQAIANAVDLSLLGGSTSTPPGNGSVVSLRAHANGDYVTADNAGASPLIANRTAIGPWEQFDLLDEGGGYIALRAHANNKYVTADNAGAAPLLAKVDAVGTWEQFQLIHNTDGSISLQSRINNDYVTADNAGADPLIANRTAIGPWEEFDLITD
ncbi:GDSL-type esterase/lipase family protein [Actinacidiphila guanduensis]|uniref:Lysophospholipase L1 n=1 Tax=Actinacidiphila guanduensis TaxID=310781 RepID=A0A1H0MUD1_9ACTN|nr:GDSL-type esterase/lipase family protein [Actinacidiphila guanduensis]SDO83984.1 Lysophospholipase L1 [Actinacidiphila guanduensis]